MTMAPRCENKNDYYGYFQKTRKLGEEIWKDLLHRDGEPVLSMGMSESFSAATAEGADLVRVGRRLFAHEN